MSGQPKNIKQHFKSETGVGCLFFSLGINSFLPHFRLAYQLNKNIGLKLIREKEDFSVGLERIPLYSYTNLGSLEEWFLFPNKVFLSEVDRKKPVIDLGFYKSAPSRCLLEIFKEAEAFLVCKNPLETTEDKILSEIKKIKEIKFSFLLDCKRFASSLELNFL